MINQTKKNNDEVKKNSFENHSYFSSIDESFHDLVMSSHEKAQLSKQKKSFDENQLSVWTKLCFAMGGMPYQMFFSAIGIFAQIFFLEVAELPPGKIIFVLFVSRFIVASFFLIY